MARRLFKISRKVKRFFNILWWSWWLTVPAWFLFLNLWIQWGNYLSFFHDHIDVIYFCPVLLQLIWMLAAIIYVFSNKKCANKCKNSFLTNLMFKIQMAISSITILLTLLVLIRVLSDLY